jgi:hypothetical protein
VIVLGTTTITASSQAPSGNTAASIAALEKQADALYQQQNFAAAFPLYLKAANLGSAHSENQVGLAYMTGYGTTRNVKLGMSWIRKAAAQGDPHSEFTLGLNYLNGSGTTPPDYATAMLWFQKAAAQGEPVAETNLGDMYAKGEGVAKDPVQARFWYLKAAAQGQGPLRNAPGQPAPAPQQAGPQPAAADVMVPSLGSCVTTHMWGPSVVPHNSCNQLIELTVWADDGGYFASGVGPNEDELIVLFSPKENLRFFACPANSAIQDSNTGLAVTYNTQNYECKSFQ